MQHYGIIGCPLGHSASQAHFTAKFQAEQIDAEYSQYELQQIADFVPLVERIQFAGMNVTAPYKQQVIPYLDELDSSAADIHAVNVIRFAPDGRRIGYNTDLIGFREAIRPLLGDRQSALVLGTGGASRAIEGALRQLGVQCTLVSRQPKAEEGRSAVISYAEVTPQVVAATPIIINATPLGMAPLDDQCPDIPYQHLTPHHLLFDAVYNPAKTVFLQRGEAQGCTIENGKQMHHLQAIAAWDIWSGNK